MDALLADTTNGLQTVHYQLAELERATTSFSATAIASDIERALDGINENCRRLEQYASREPPQRRTDAKYKVDQLIYDHQHLKASLTALTAKVTSRFRQQADRDELLARRYTANETSISVGGAGEEADHNSRLRSAHTHIDELIDHGHAVLQNLRFQHGTLKGARRRALDVLNQLGLSNTVLQFIEQRTQEDKVVLFGGMAITTLLLVFIYYWVKY